MIHHSSSVFVVLYRFFYASSRLDAVMTLITSSSLCLSPGFLHLAIVKLTPGCVSLRVGCVHAFHEWQACSCLQQSRARAGRLLRLRGNRPHCSLDQRVVGTMVYQLILIHRLPCIDEVTPTDRACAADGFAKNSFELIAATATPNILTDEMLRAEPLAITWLLIRKSFDP